MIQNNKINHIISWKYLVKEGDILVIIGISARLVDGVYKVNESLIEKIKINGVIPLVIVPGFDNSRLISMCNGFIIPGGVTWNEIDEEIIKYAIKMDMPLLGICAGMQALANIHNFDKDILSDQTIPIGNDSHDSKSKYVHDISITNKFLYDILGSKKIGVNSRHKFKVTKKNYFSVDAYSDDGLIEAIHLPNKTFILGVQWHPEDLDDEFSKKIFACFIERCKIS